MKHLNMNNLSKGRRNALCHTLFLGWDEILFLIEPVSLNVLSTQPRAQVTLRGRQASLSVFQGPF